MRLFDRLRGDPVVRQLRNEPVLAVPDGVSAYAVESCTRRWAPRAVRDSDGSMVLSSTVRLCGPIARTEQRWRAAGVPADAAACYVALTPPELPKRTYGRRDLVLGLHRRLGGWCRVDKDEGWRDTSTYRQPQDLSVYAPVALAPDDIVRLLAEHVPGLRLSEFEPDSYELDSAHVRIDVDRWAPDIFETYPWIQIQPWHRPTEPVVEYALYTHDDDGNPDVRRSVGHALRSLATATTGVVLDVEGFPWPDEQ